jgi:hypothetical protein
MVSKPTGWGRSSLPTEAQKVVELHETLFSETWSTPGGFTGLEVTDHVDPFHSSARDAKAGDGVEPTAIQNVTFTHETLESEASPGGLGTTDQVEPFHDSTKVPSAPPPTATQKATVVHETPARSTADSSAGSGLGTTDQLPPFHDSMSELDRPLPAALPTPTQNDGPTHDTAVNSLKLVETFGLVEMDHCA